MQFKDAHDIFIMVFNMESQSDTEDLFATNKKVSNHFDSFDGLVHQMNDNSNEAVAGDLMTMVDESRERVHDGTLSTGAETPFSFFGS